MSSPAFTLSVPTAEPFRSLVADAVRTYLGRAGKEHGEGADAFVAEVGRAVEALSQQGDEVGLTVVARSPEIDVQLTCGGASRTLTHKLESGA